MKFKNNSFLLLVFILFSSTLLISCLGKTRPAITKPTFILPKNKRRIYITYPVNLTSHFLLDQKLRKAVMEYFEKDSLWFSVTDDETEAKSYLSLIINRYDLNRTIIKFHDNQAVNRIFHVELEVSLQDSPKEFISFSLTGKSKENKDEVKTYLDNETLLTYRFYYLDLQDPEYSKENIENQFLQEIAKEIEKMFIKK